MKKNEKEILQALLHAMSFDLDRHMEEEFGEKYLEFRDKYWHVSIFDE